MDKKLLTSYQSVLEQFSQAIMTLRQVRDEYSDYANCTDMEDAADNVYVLKKMDKYVADLGKEIRKLTRYMEAATCHHAIMDGRSRIETRFCLGKASTKEMAKIPNKRRLDPESFDKVMQYLGVPEELYMGLKEDGSDAELVRPHWPNVQERINQDLAEGKQVPVNKVESGSVFEFKVTKDKKVI